MTSDVSGSHVDVLLGFPSMDASSALLCPTLCVLVLGPAAGVTSMVSVSSFWQFWADVFGDTAIYLAKSSGVMPTAHLCVGVCALVRGLRWCLVLGQWLLGDIFGEAWVCGENKIYSVIDFTNYDIAVIVASLFLWKGWAGNEVSTNIQIRYWT